MLSRALTTVVAVFTLLLVAAVASVAWYFYIIHKPSLNDIPTHVLPCDDITQACKTPNFKLRFDRVPQVMQAFELVVEPINNSSTPGLPPTAIHASFGMAGMPMGLNRYRLEQQADKTWHATVTLPVCIQGKSEWTMLLELKAPGEQQKYQLNFDAIGR